MSHVVKMLLMGYTKRSDHPHLPQPIPTHRKYTSTHSQPPKIYLYLAPPFPTYPYLQLLPLTFTQA